MADTKEATHEYEVQGKYGTQYGWECVTAEADFPEAKQRLREYRENEPGTPFRIKRVKVTR